MNRDLQRLVGLRDKVAAAKQEAGNMSNDGASQRLDIVEEIHDVQSVLLEVLIEIDGAVMLAQGAFND